MIKTHTTSKNNEKRKQTVDYELRFKQAYAMMVRLEQKYKQITIKYNQKNRENQQLKAEIAQLKERIRIKGE